MNAFGVPMSPPAEAKVRSAVTAPAILLALLSGIMCAIFLLDFFLFGTMDFTRVTGSTIDDPERERILVCAVMLFAFTANAVAFFGALQMLLRRRWPFAIAAAIIAMLPFTTSACCVVGLPIGIWALVVLNKPEVKATFR